MTMYQRPDSHIPEEVDNEISFLDWKYQTGAILSIVMAETVMDGIFGFPFLHRLIAYTELIFRLFWRQ